MSLIEEEASLLREKNLQLSFQLESMKHLFDENIRLKQLLNFKRESKLNIYPARVSNMGASPHLSSSLSIDIGSNLGVSINDPVMTPSGIMGKLS
jgi:Cell shape-determining protein